MEQIVANMNIGTPLTSKSGIAAAVDIERMFFLLKTTVTDLLYKLSFLAEACFLDILLILVIWRITSYLMSMSFIYRPINYVWERMPNFSKLFISTHRAQIDFLNENQLNWYGGRAATYTPTFKAVVHKATQIKDERIWHLRIENESESYNYDDEERIPESVEHVLQQEAIEVEPGMFLQFSEDDEERPSVNEGGRLYIRKSKAVVFSETYLVSDLKKAVERWTEEYRLHKGEQLFGRQLIFLVRFKEKDAEVVYTDFNSNRCFDNFFFEKKERCLDEIEFFLENKEWYEERGLQDALGILAYGVPGCGKTSFIKALLKYTGRHAVIFSINENTSLEKIETLMRTDVLCDFPIPQNKRVYVLEDIDAMGDIVTKRQTSEAGSTGANKDGDSMKEEIHVNALMKALAYESSRKSENHLSFLLNILDGVVESQGRIVIMTTNHVDKLDPALIRPGRVDLKLEFRRCSKKVISQILGQFYGYEFSAVHKLLPPEWVDEVFTPAELIRLCRAHKHDLHKLVEHMKEAYQKEIDKFNTQEDDVPDATLKQVFFEQPMNNPKRRVTINEG